MFGKLLSTENWSIYDSHMDQLDSINWQYPFLLQVHIYSFFCNQIFVVVFSWNKVINPVKSRGVTFPRMYLDPIYYDMLLVWDQDASWLHVYASLETIVLQACFFTKFKSRFCDIAIAYHRPVLMLWTSKGTILDVL